MIYSPTNDAISENCKIVSIELASSNMISVKFAGDDQTGISNLSNYQEGSLSYVLNRWYWIYAGRTQNGLSSSDQYLGIYDPTIASFVFSITDSWSLLYTLADISSSGLMIYADGFQGFAEGFCGSLRGVVVMPGTAFTNFNTAFEYLGQKQSGGSLSDLLLYMPFNSKTGPTRSWLKQ